VDGPWCRAGDAVTTPRQPDLFNRSAAQRPARVAITSRIPAERSAAPEPFDFTGEGCVPDPNYVAPDFLRLPTDDPEFMPAPAVGRRG
jgi:hypothetical protein